MKWFFTVHCPVNNQKNLPRHDLCLRRQTFFDHLRGTDACRSEAFSYRAHVTVVWVLDPCRVEFDIWHAQPQATSWSHGPEVSLSPLVRSRGFMG